VIGISGRPRETAKIEGRDTPTVRHLPIQETLQSLHSSGTLTQGPINGKPVEVVGLQLTRPKFSGALKKKPQKSVVGQSDTRVLCNWGTKPHPSKQWVLKEPDLWAVNLSK